MPEALRVLLVHFRDDEGAGGSLRVGQTLAGGLRRLGVAAEMCFAYGPAGPVGRAAGVPCHYLGVEGSRDVRRWRRFRALLDAAGPDVIHFMDPSIWMHALALGHPARKVLHVHGAVFFGERPSLKDRVAMRFVSGCADHLVAITHGARRSVVERGLAPAGRVSVVSNGVDPDDLDDRPSRAAARRLMGLPEDALVIGMVCRLVDTRGCDDLLRILQRLEPAWHGLLVGDGPARAGLERLARRLGVASRVRFAGSLADVRPAYSALDAYALLALYDSFGLATAEAMACGVPVFGLAGGGEYREPEGPLVTPDNAVFLDRRSRRRVDEEENPAVLDGLAARLAEYGRHPDRLGGMVERASRHVRSRFTRDLQAAAMLSVYGSLLQDRSPHVLPRPRSTMPRASRP